MATTYYLTTTGSDLDRITADNFSNALSESAPGTTTLAVVLANGDGTAAIDEQDTAYTPSGDPGADGVTGNYTVRVEIGTGDTAVQLDLALARVNSGGTLQTGPTTSNEGLTACATGTLTFTWTSLNLGTWASGDRLELRFDWNNTSEHGGSETVTLDIGTAGVDMDAPWTAAVNVSPTGLDASPSFGSPTIASAHTVSPAGLDASATFGTAAVGITVPVTPTGLDASASFGSPTIASAHTVTPTGLDASATFGTATATDRHTAAPTGLDASAAFGSPTIASAHTLTPTGLDASPTFGAATLSVGGALTVTPTGLDASPTFGTATATDRHTAAPTGLDASATFGTPSIASAHTVAPTGLDASASFGAPSANVAGALTVAPTGLDASATFGAPALSVVAPVVASGRPVQAVGGSGRGRRRRGIREDAIAEQEWRRVVREATKRREEESLLAMFLATLE